MKKITSMILTLLIMFTLSTNSFADSNFTEISYDKTSKIKDSYIVNENGTISRKDNSRDKYSKSVNFLINIGAIEVDSSGNIKDYFSEQNYTNLKSNLKENKKIDYDKLYQESINPSGAYYGIMPEEEFNNIVNFLDNTMVKENFSEVVPFSLEFDYYYHALRNTVLLSNSYLSYINMGSSEAVGIMGAGLFFVDKVKTGGDWDYKQSLGTSTRYYCNMKNYYGNYSGESIGNMHYGTVGSYLFTPGILKSAAGLYQFLGGNLKLSWISTYFDDPRDQANIETGINLHSSYGFPTAY